MAKKVELKELPTFDRLFTEHQECISPREREIDLRLGVKAVHKASEPCCTQGILIRKSGWNDSD